MKSIGKEIINIIRNKGFKAFFVGGFVRNMILQKPAKDIDICTNATPDKIISIFENIDGYTCKKAGAHFGVVIISKGSYDFEIATFRKDIGSDGRRPLSVVYATEKEDVYRRDFTINGLLYDPINDSIIDHINGIQDIKNRIIRSIGNPNVRFQEDFLRMMRAIRFSSQYDFHIERKTYNAIKNNAHHIISISKERIYDELLKIFNSNNSYKGIKYLFSTGIIKYILPEVFHIWKGNRRKLYSIMRGPLQGGAPSILAILLKDYSPSDACSILKNRLKIDNDTLNKVKKALQCKSLFPKNRIDIAKAKKILLDDDHKVIVDFIKYIYPKVYKNLYRYNISSQSFPKQVITGKDLLDIGIPKGKIYKDILDKIYLLQLNGIIFTKKQAIAIIKIFF